VTLRPLPVLLPLLLLGGILPAQEPSPASPSDSRYVVDDEAFEKASGEKTETLAKDGKLVPYTEIARRIPAHRDPVTAAPLCTDPLTPPRLAEKLRHSTVAVGLRYQEPHSRKWRYMIGATAFAVAPETLSTALHVMTIDPNMMRDAEAVAVTEEGRVFPITQVVASSDRADTCLVHVPGLDLPPLALRTGVLPGEQVWCMSHPDGFAYMFTSGQVARVSRDRWDKKHQPALHLEVTAEYCPGSSGGPVTDAAGNVVAQVSSINNYDGFSSGDGKSVNGIVSARTCTAAEELALLLAAGENEAVPLPSPEQRKRRRARSPHPVRRVPRKKDPSRRGDVPDGRDRVARPGFFAF